ncbi:hypothetical protein K438DRAFT_1856989 [Mycena galopus ATCC 62051]|nr:hypothetical protein K438DRAFT_1856989 [Mycena galopus ATCC 62051]
MSVTGSTSAPDPYAKNAHLTRESSSILTIVKVATPPFLPERPPSPRRIHRRIGSNPSSPLPSPGAVDPTPPGRLSFAFSSFGAPHQPSSASGPGSPRYQPALYSPSPAVTPSVASHSPILPPRSSSPQQPISQTVAPATFTPLPPDVYLPFLDRPAEVKALLSSPPSAKLFALLAQTFPKNTTRDEASDAFWVQTARRCILKHSELIWERLKGALVHGAEYHDVFESDDESDEVLEMAKKSAENSEEREATVDFHDERRSAESSPSSSPVLASSESTIMSPNPPPLSLPASLSGDATGLGDIGEEDEEDDRTPEETPPQVEVEPPLVHGLRISTPATPMLPYSPGIALRSATTGAPLRSPSFSARDSGGHGSRPHSPTMVRSGSSHSLHRSGSFGSVRSVSSSDRDRDPEAPNPALRSPTLPPQSKYKVGMGLSVRRSSSTRSVDRGNRFRRSWGYGDDYAVTLASGSSAGGSVRDETFT